MDEIEILNSFDFKTKIELLKLDEMLRNKELYKNKSWVQFFQNAISSNKTYHLKFYLIGHDFLKKMGKIKIATEYFEIFLSLLFEMKRIPELKKLTNSLVDSNHFRKKISDHINYLENKNVSSDLKMDIEFSSYRFEIGIDPKNRLQLKVKENPQWNKEKLMNIYEYVLRYGSDEFILNQIENKIIKNDQYNANFLELKKKYNSKKESPLKRSDVNLDDVALNYFYEKECDEGLEDRINSYLNHESYENIVMKGKEMLLAFKMIGMSKVVHSLADKLMAFDLPEKEKIEVASIKANEYSEMNELANLVDFIENVVIDLELTSVELSEFYYLIFNLGKRLNKKNITKVYSDKISRLSTGNEEVSRRIKLFEKN